MVDKVQLLLSTIDGKHSGPDVNYSEAVAPPSASSAPTTQHTTRTKIVFLYSDDEDLKPHDCSTSSSGLTGTNAQTDGTYNCVSLPLDSHMRIVSCSDSLQPDAETLVELQEDAQNAYNDRDAAIGDCGYTEDVIGTVSDSFPVSSTLPKISLAEDILASARICSRVVPITPYGLNPGHYKAQDTIFVAEKQQLRCGLTTEELARFQGRRRLRSGSDEDADECNSNSSSFNNKRVSTEAIRGEGLTVAMELEAVVDEGGSTVRAIRNGPYCLTVDERDLIGESEGHQGEPVSCENGDLDPSVDVAVDALSNASHDEYDLDDNNVDEDDDSDDDCELDMCLVVAVVEQLVQCCESEDLDPKMQREANRFLGIAKPLLAQLENGTISSNTFAQLVDHDVRRFHRIFKSVYRPRDEPIVIGGVQMDL